MKPQLGNLRAIWRETLPITLLLIAPMALHPFIYAQTTDELRREYERATGRFTQGVTVTNAATGGVVRGVKMVDLRATGEASGSVARLLIVSPGGRPLVLTWVSEPRTGRMVTRLLDEESGWWIELWQNIGFEAEDAAHAAALWLSPEAWWRREPGGASEPVLAWVAVRTQGGVEIGRTVDIASEDFGVGAFLAQVRGEELWRSVVREIPISAVEGVVFLEQAAASTPANLGISSVDTSGVEVKQWRDLVSVVATSLRDARILLPHVDRSEKWVVKIGAISVDRDVEAASDVELMKRFGSIDPANPLPEQEVSELLISVREAAEPGQSRGGAASE